MKTLFRNTSTTRERVNRMRLRFTSLRCVLVCLVLGFASQASATETNGMNPARELLA
jgi:hypothetical protein